MMLLPILLVLAQSPAEPALTLTGTFPPGPMGDLLSGLSTDEGLVVPAVAPGAAAWPSWSDTAAWSQPEPWRAWTDAAQHQWSADAPMARAAHRKLAILASNQHRSEDAWAHLQHLTAQDAAGLLPLFVAGIGSGEDAPVLEPILPPIPVYDVATWTELPPFQEYRLEGLRIDETTFTLSVQVPPEGVEVRFIHESGPALDLFVRIPAPANRTKRIEYVDWTRVEADEGVNPIHRITLVPESEDLVLWARCAPRRLPWPEAKAGASFPRDRNIELLTAPADPELPRLRGFAEAASRVLGIDVTASTSGPEHGALQGPAPLRIDLNPSEFQAAKLASLISQIEGQQPRPVEAPAPE